MPSPAKVLFLVNTLCAGGAERNVAALCERIDQNRFLPEVWILCGGGEFEDQVRCSGIQLRNLDRRWARNPLFACKTASEISRCDADLIHVFLPSIAAYAALARTCFGVRQPMVMSLGQSRTAPIERCIFRWCSCTFDWLVANSPSAKELGQSLGFATNRISLIPNGHHIDRYQSCIDRRSVRESLGVGLEERMLLCVGRLVDTKRVIDAVVALELLGESSRAKLVIVGEGPERGALVDEVSGRGLSQRVVFAGHRSDVSHLLQAADLFVFPSETEGLPNALIEACLAGLPIVACSVRGVTDVVQEGETALLVPPRSPAALAAAMRRLLLDPAEARRLGTEARARAQESYSIERSLSALYDVYDRLLDSRRPRAAGQPVELCMSE